MKSEFYWFGSSFNIAPGVARLAAGDDALIFCEPSQKLSRINETADFIWRGLEAGSTCSQVSRQLCLKGAPSRDADAFVESAVVDWLRLGYLTPREIAEELERQPSAVLSLSIGSLAMLVRFFGDADAEAATAILGHFRADTTESNTLLDVVGHNGSTFLFLNGAPVGMCARNQVVPQIKAQITAAYARTIRDGFLAHSAMVSVNDKRILISGAPGAGKTTLTLALASSGLSYGGDDIVRFEPDGAAAGIPFPAAAKSGSWALLDGYVGGLSALPTYERVDGVRLRYVIPAQLETGGPRPIDAALFLERKDGAAARVDPITPLEALCILLDSAWSERHFTEAATIAALARDLSRAKLYRLVYSDLAGAVAIVARLADE